jgi:hypothetical protein
MSGKHKEKTEAFTFYMPKTMIAELRAWSAESDAPVSAIIRRLIKNALETHKAEIKRG